MEADSRGTLRQEKRCRKKSRGGVSRVTLWGCGVRLKGVVGTLSFFINPYTLSFYPETGRDVSQDDGHH